MHLRVGINGFGRIGKLLLRVLSDRFPELTVTHINDPGMDTAVAAHLLQFDSSHGRWATPCSAQPDALLVNGRIIRWTQAKDSQTADWASDTDLVVECSGRSKKAPDAEHFFAAGAKHVLVSAPLDGALNLVRGVNDGAYHPDRDRLLSAASCTTNCLAPLIKVLHENFSIRHGLITTIHAITNDQSLLDQGHKDLRRARAAGASLIPTSTGVTRVIGQLFPDLSGKLNGIAVRAPVTNASLTDAVLHLDTNVDPERILDVLHAAAQGPLEGILGVEDQPLVSADYCGDTRSCVVDAPTLQVIDDRLVKILAWYDNETAYVHRLAEITARVATQS